LLASESETPGVVDRVSGGPDVLASLADVVDGAVMIFTMALEGDARVLQSAMDDLAAGIPARRRRGVGDITPGIPKYPCIMSNIHYISD
jgi:hypothetical protein